MLAAGAVLRLPSGSTGISVSSATTMASPICGPVIGAWSYPIASTKSDGCRPGSVEGAVQSIAVTPGEYLVSHVVNGKPILPLNSSSVGQFVGQPFAPVSSTSQVGVI